jgi:hypothetical protein
MHAPTPMYPVFVRIFRSFVAAVALVIVFAAAPPALAVTPGGAPNLFLASPTEVDFALDTPAAAPTAELPAAPADGNLTMTIDPSLLAEPTPAGAAAGQAPAAPAAETPKKGPPLPLHTTEGTGGALFVPFAYLVNPGPPGTIITPPAPSYTFVKVGHKTINQFVVTTTVARRIELGYALGIFTLGDFVNDVRHHGINFEMEHITMHMFSVRGMLIEEGKYNPAVTAGATFKYNPDIWAFNRRLGGAPVGLGLKKDHSTDFILTASKTFGNALFGRPIIASAGLRFSEAAQLGYFGFGDAYRLTWEADLCYMPTDWLAISYEYRQKKNPYRTLKPLVGDEDDWHAVCLAFILSDRLTFACGWGAFGNVANNREDGVWGLQFKYEF